MRIQTLHFGMWISPRFQLLLVKEFKRLKAEEAARIDSGWDIRRFMAKANYSIQADAIKDVLVPISNLSKDKIGIVYAEEAELINYALFNMSSKDWKQQNPELCLKGMNIRDLANTHQLIVLSNLESLNAELIKANKSKDYRLKRLREIAIENLQSLAKSRHSEHFLVDSPNRPKQIEKPTKPSRESKLDQQFKGSMAVTPSKKKRSEK